MEDFTVPEAEATFVPKVTYVTYEAETENLEVKVSKDINTQEAKDLLN